MKTMFPASLRVIGRSIVDWWDSWVDNVVMILLWSASLVTIVLAAPATFGFYYVIYEMTNGTTLGFRGMVSGARKYFWKSLLWGFIFLFGTLLVVLNYWFYSQVEPLWGRFVQGIVILIGFIWFSTQFYTIPFFMMREDNSLKIALKNGFLTTLATPFFSLILMVVVIFAVGISFAFVLPLFLGVPALIPIMGFRALYNRLEAFGLREREKTPQEIELEASKGVDVTGLNWIPGQGATGKAHPQSKEAADEQEGDR